ncbi:hypothetical protein QBC40DRAFT_272097 [Triangularia verruculosa]|uniref:Signal recognition particle subunit SRP68 n=1 Tax=Triangularia verruculosa TaxID=2587418 RepID=A0AAN6XQK9_9PEZI|nr:hypothetical protein QBC40DRAFT_272097 [Triangularia verruculosa]
MDITKFVVSHRESALLYGDYSTYQRQLSKKLLNCRKKLNIATKKRGTFQTRNQLYAEQVAEDHRWLHLHLLTAERAWANAMAIKAAHSVETKGIGGKTRSHIASRLDKGAQIAEDMAEVIVKPESGASWVDQLEARAYAALLRGAALFEKQHWEPCLKSYSVARVIYSQLSTSTKGDIFRDLLSETIDPSIRYAAYQAKIPRTQPVDEIAWKYFSHAVAERHNALQPILDEQRNKKSAMTSADAPPATLTWRGREVKIEDAAIAVAWASVGTEKVKLSEKLSSAASVNPRELAGAYDDILVASQDAVDATKQAIDELKSEGVPQSDSRMQSLQITRTAVNFEMISWRIGRNRVLIGQDDGARLDFSSPARKKKQQEQTEETPDDKGKDLTPGRQIAKLKEKVVLYDGILQSLESIKELPGVANDQELSTQLEATSQYFTALKCLAISRSHAIAGSAVNALALVKHALDQCNAAHSVLSGNSDDGKSAPRNIQVTNQHVGLLRDILGGELQRSRALVEIHNLNKPTSASQTGGAGKPLSSQLLNYPAGGVDLNNIVTYPPQLEPIPVKPLFLDVAWNYIEYPSKQRPVAAAQERSKGIEKEPEPEVKPQKRGWFGFGR